MRIFKNAWFQKFARKEEIDDATLCDAISRAEKGLIDADLGGGLLKQRVGRPGAGKSGGYRTLIFFRADERAIFAFGFAKSARANLDRDEEAIFKKAAKFTLAFSEVQMDTEVEKGRLVEVKCDDQDLQK